MDSFDFENYLTRYSTHDEDVRLHMVQFLYEIQEGHALEESSFGDYVVPSGALTSRVFHLLHWPPKYARSQPWSSFDFEAYSTRLVTKAFPGSKQNHFFHDLFCKRTEINHPGTGQRKTDAEIYQSEWLLRKHQNFTRTLLEASSALIIAVWGGAARRFFEKEYGISPVAGVDKYRVVEDVVIGGFERTVVFLPHPEYIQRWADQPVLDAVSSVVETLRVDYDIDVDLVAMEAVLCQRPELTRKFFEQKVRVRPMVARKREPYAATKARKDRRVAREQAALGISGERRQVSKDLKAECRLWLSEHANDPYPSDTQIDQWSKANLVSQTVIRGYMMHARGVMKDAKASGLDNGFPAELSEKIGAWMKSHNYVDMPEGVKQGFSKDFGVDVAVISTKAGKVKTGRKHSLKELSATKEVPKALCDEMRKWYRDNEDVDMPSSVLESWGEEHSVAISHLNLMMKRIKKRNKSDKKRGVLEARDVRQKALDEKRASTKKRKKAYKVELGDFPEALSKTIADWYESNGLVKIPPATSESWVEEYGVSASQITYKAYTIRNPIQTKARRDARKPAKY